MEETLANPRHWLFLTLTLQLWDIHTPCVTTWKECLGKPCFENGRLKKPKGEHGFLFWRYFWPRWERKDQRETNLCFGNLNISKAFYFKVLQSNSQIQKQQQALYRSSSDILELLSCRSLMNKYLTCCRKTFDGRPGWTSCLSDRSLRLTSQVLFRLHRAPPPKGFQSQGYKS